MTAFHRRTLPQTYSDDLRVDVVTLELAEVEAS